MTHGTRKKGILWAATALAVVALAFGCAAPTGPVDPGGVQTADGPASPDDTPPGAQGQRLAIDFDTATPGYVAKEFAGAGIVHNPPPGYLDADGWQILGFSDGDLLYGEEASEGDFARGTSPGSVGTGGLYAFEVEPGNVALGVQPTADDFSPGSISMRIPVTLDAVTELDLGYTLWVYNDQNRSSRWSVAYSADAASWTGIPELQIVTPQEAVSPASWESTRLTHSVDVSALGLARGDTLHIRWSSEDYSGSGGRDEAAIDDIEVSLE